MQRLPRFSERGVCLNDSFAEDGYLIDLNYDYSQELSIVWLQDPSLFSCLRESSQKMTFREKAPKRSSVPHLLVGYVTLKPTAKAASPGRFYRRFWWLKEHDLPNSNGWPAEGVDSRSIQAGKPSSRPDQLPSRQL